MPGTPAVLVWPRFTVSTGWVPTFGYFELLVETGRSTADPFRSVVLSAVVTRPTGETFTTKGFCDSQDGSAFRIRVLAQEPGSHQVEVTFEAEGQRHTHSLSFTADQPDTPGFLETDGWHFRWSGTKERFFWNATTTYLMAGLKEDLAIKALDRLADQGINRIRLSLCPTRQTSGQRWGEPAVTPRADFTFHYGPWPQANPESQAEPGFDTTRFDVAYWQKYERILAYARSRDIIVQVIFFTDAQEDQNYPFDREIVGNNPLEDLYYRYAIARLGAFSNVEWCVTNEWALFRPDEWGDIMGNLLMNEDPYPHPRSIHGHGHFPFRASPWVTHALFQVWDEDGGYEWMIEKRREQLEAGRIIPQINEEYGYEDTYPVPWGFGKVWPARCADTRRRIAWGITMAGGYQTTGESAQSGTGGWINGLGDESMTMLLGYQHLRNFMESLGNVTWEPDLEIVAKPQLALKLSDGRAVIYSPNAEPLPTEIKARASDVRIFAAATGVWGNEIEPNSDQDLAYVVSFAE